jgi:hypothetical protein
MELCSGEVVGWPTLARRASEAVGWGKQTDVLVGLPLAANRVTNFKTLNYR